MPDSADAREPKQSKPPYLFLIPVAVGVVAFIGYETARMASDPHGAQPTFVAGVPLTLSTLTPHRAPVSRIAVDPARGARRVVLAAHAAPTPAPKPSATPDAPPSITPSPTAAPPSAGPSHAPARVVEVKPLHEGVHRFVLARATVPHVVAAPAGFSQITPTPVAPETPVPVAATEAPPEPTAAPTAEPVVVAVNEANRITDAKMTYAATPDYPPMAREQGIRGTSVVFVTVDGRGSVIHTSIANSSGNASLDRAAIAAARASRYATAKGQPRSASATYRVVYDFSP